MIKKKKIPVILLDTVGILILSVLIFILKKHIEYTFLMVFVITFLFVYMKRKKIQVRNLLLAFFIALMWSFLGREYYNYNFNYAKLLGISLMPLFAWALGLYALYLFYSYHNGIIGFRNWYLKFVFYVFLYWFFLILMETIAFHVIGIKDVATSQYKGLPICNCIHAPLFMKFVYFSLGIIYFIFVKIFEIYFPLKVKGK